MLFFRGAFALGVWLLLQLCWPVVASRFFARLSPLSLSNPSDKSFYTLWPNCPFSPVVGSELFSSGSNVRIRPFPIPPRPLLRPRISFLSLSLRSAQDSQPLKAHPPPHPDFSPAVSAPFNSLFSYQKVPFFLLCCLLSQNCKSASPSFGAGRGVDWFLPGRVGSPRTFVPLLLFP